MSALPSGYVKHYQLNACLGEGGFGQVYQAWDSKLQRSVAIKRLKNQGLLGPGANLLREARMAASLQHAAFVKIHALEDDEDSQAIVMELVQGQTLKQVLQVGPLAPEQVLDMVRQIAEAMQQAHAAGLTHGDLKPSNLMLEPSGTVRILDFGLASQADAQATTSMLQLDPQGTIAYMAPERLLGAALSPQSDIYALGVILYELATGRRPHASLGGMALAAAQVHSSSDLWDYPASMAPALVQLVRAMTAKKPDERLKSMQQVLTGLAALVGGAGARVAAPSILLDGAGQAVSAPSFDPAQTALIDSVAPHSGPRQTGRKHLLRHKALLASTLVLVLALSGAAWKLQPYWGELLVETAPFSESLELKKGLAALEQWDRPGSEDEAIKRFSNIVERNPEHAAAVAGLSIAYGLRYNSDKQDETWQQKSLASAQLALKLNPHLALSYIARGRVLREQGEHQRALESYEQALRLDPASMFAWDGKVRALRAMGERAQALKLAESALQRFPRERIFEDLIGAIYADQGNYKEAELAFRRSITIQPDAVYAYANLSGALLFQNRNDEALHVLQQGLQIRPSALLYKNLGNAYFLRGEYVDAAAAFEMAVSPTHGNPRAYDGWANLADTLLWVPGRKREAAKAYETARRLLRPLLAKSPADVKLLSRMALYAARVGDKDECATLLQRALARSTSTPDLHFRVGLAYELIGERQLALREIETAHRLGHPLKLIEAEPDLVALRRDPNYLLR